MDALANYPWPGNIRELQNVIKRTVILSPGPSLQVPLADLQTRDSRPKFEGQDSRVESKPTAPNNVPSGSGLTLAESERNHILNALRETGWVMGGPSGAAAKLGMKRSLLYWKMKKLGISRSE